MAELLKQTFELFIKKRWLKRIDKECDEYIRLKRCLNIQQNIVNGLVRKYEEIYGEDLRLQLKERVRTSEG